jgi:hypothetical protein
LKAILTNIYIILLSKRIEKYLCEIDRLNEQNQQLKSDRTSVKARLKNGLEEMYKFQLKESFKLLESNNNSEAASLSNSPDILNLTKFPPSRLINYSSSCRTNSSKRESTHRYSQPPSIENFMISNSKNFDSSNNINQILKTANFSTFPKKISSPILIRFSDNNSTNNQTKTKQNKIEAATTTAMFEVLKSN